MALVTCKECGTEVSDTAAACPKCGARVKPFSNTWLYILSAIGLVIAIVVIFAIKGANDPEIQAKSHDRRVYETCMKEFNDPLVDAGAKRTIIAPACLRMRNDFIAKYGREP